MSEYEPYGWVFTDDDGIQRQVKIHYTRDGRAVVWDPRYPGDPRPWFDADHEESDPTGHYADADLVTLGMPVASWSTF